MTYYEKIEGNKYGIYKDEYCTEESNYEFKDGDILILAKMPFDCCGFHATGKAIAENGKWLTEYETPTETFLDYIEEYDVY